MPLSQDDQKKYKALYLQTAGQYVKELEDNMAHLQAGKETDEVVASLHRASHSLNSQSQMMNYQQMVSIASLLEKIFQAKKENGQKLSEELVTTIATAVQSLKACLENIDKSDSEKDLSQEKEKLQTLSNISS